MSHDIAIDWESHQLCGLEAEVSKGRVRVRHSFCLKWPEEIDPVGDPQQAGSWLKGELSRLGISGKSVLISLPREDAVVRQLDLPNAPDEELPDLVRLQAETKSAASLDKLLMDYLPLPVPADAVGRGVLMVTVAHQTVNQIRAVLKAADLELESIGVSSVATSELTDRTEQRRGFDPHETILVIGRHGDRVEISIMRQRHLLFAHSTQLSGESSDADNKLILSEVNRSVIALSTLLEGKRIERAWVIGDDDENVSLIEFLGGRLSCPVEALDPFELNEVTVSSALPERRAMFAGPLGVLLEKSGAATESLDFLAPRKPVVKPDRTRARMSIAAVGLLLIFGVAYGGMYFHLSRLDAQLESLRKDYSDMDREIKDGKPILKSSKLVGNWEQRNINWLDQLQEYQELSPGTDQIYLKSYSFSAPFSSGDVLVNIEAVGQARSGQQVRELSQNLDDQEYQVQPTGKPPQSTDKEEKEYPYAFQLESQIMAGHFEKKKTPGKAVETSDGTKTARLTTNKKIAGR